MATEYSEQLKKLDEQAKKIKKTLSLSPTAYTSNVEPTSGDISAEKRYKNILNKRQAVENKSLQEKWYGEGSQSEEESSKNKEGLISKVLHGLSTPLYGVVGAAEAVLGKGTKPGLANIVENIKEKETFSNLLQKFNAPKYLSAPVGFMLDIAFDPVNWATAGTGALIPRVALGLKKGGLEVAKKGAVSSLLGKAAFTSKVIPYIGKKYSKGLAVKATKIGREYEDAMGITVSKMLEENTGRARLGEKIGNWLSQYPMGKKFVDATWSKSKKWFETAKLIDDIEGTAREGERFLTTSPGDMRRGIETIEATSLGANKLDNVVDDIFSSAPDAKRSLANIVNKNVSDGIDLATDRASLARAGSSDEVLRRLNEEYANDEVFRDAVNQMKALSSRDTGVQWFDNMIKKISEFKIKDVEVGKKFLDAYDKFIGLFKLGKVAISPPAYVNGVAGNVTMPALAGLKIYDPGFLGNVKDAFNLINGKVDQNTINLFMNSPEWSLFMKKYPGLFRKSFGFGPEFIKSKAVIDDILSQGLKSNTISENQISLVSKVLGEEQANLARIAAKKQSAAGKAVSAIAEKSKKIGGKVKKAATTRQTAEDIMAEARAAGREISAADLPTSFLTSEIYGSGAFSEWKRAIDAKAAAGSTAHKLLKAYIEKPMEFYERIDQSFKLGTAMHLTSNGVSLSELKLLSNVVPMKAADVIEYIAKDGTRKFKIKPERAVELVHEIFMNYQAMPGAVKVLRILPFLGSPFASFMYGMTTKTGKTLINNPAIFTKIQFALNDFSGTKGPLEKEKLKSKYYSWYNKGGMVKLPFFEQNPLYLNVANMIPYYSMNMFQPSERKYGKTLPDAIVQMVDRSPIMKTPEGQVMFDYFIQPLLLRESNPEGMFGQPLYPKGATPAQKAGYAIRALAETVTPGALGLAGLATPSEKILPYVPSYRWRQLGYAVRGKTPVGVTGKEPKTSRTLRALGSQFGVSTYPLNVQYKESNKK